MEPRFRPVEGTDTGSATAELWIFTHELWGFTVAAWLWTCNFVAMVAHIGFTVAAFWAGMQEGGMMNPTLTLYVTEITWMNETEGTSRFDFLPTYRRIDGGMSVAWLTVSFFLLSAAAHGIVVVFNAPCWWPQTGGCVNWYFVWIDRCMNPLRWVEYSFSASVMMVTIAYTSGIRSVYLLSCLTVLTFVTMTYGWFTEDLSRPDRDDKWKRGRWHRMVPHFLGWAPYGAAWAILLHSFYWNTRDVRDQMPSFVEPLVWVQFSLFTCFAVVQIVQQCVQPRDYFAGEIAYCVLSLAAKGSLGGMLIANTLLLTTVEAVSV
jgi:hypothetical protein